MARDGRGTFATVVALIAAAALATSAAPPKPRRTPLTSAQRASMFFQEFSWSPDGRHMLMTGMLNGGGAALYLTRANGTEAVALTDTSARCSWGAWSPDGRHIAYATRNPWSQSGAKTSDIFVMNVDGSGARWLIKASETVPRDNLSDPSPNALTPSWSPDGSRIAFVSEGFGRSAIWTVDSDAFAESKAGGNLTELCDAPGTEHNPVWSPDNQRIAFYYSSGGADSIGIVNADGSSYRSLGPGVWPHWSPHGDQLAFAAGVSGKQPDVWIMNADGSGRTRVAGPGFFARWSPNGRDVVFLRAEGEGWPRPSFLYSVRPGTLRERRWPAH